jgi:hypothetical protein
MKKDSKDPIIVYWAPHSIPEDEGMVGNWNMMYHEPTSVFKYWTEFDIKTDDRQHDSFIKCPAFKNLTKNMYSWPWPFDSSYEYESGNGSSEQVVVTPLSESYVAAMPPRNQSMTSGPAIEFAYRLHMFAEEPVEMAITGPYLQKAEYQKSGFLTSGQFDIGKWFRTINVEVQLYGNKGEIHFKKDEPIFYLNFLTDRKIIFKRFELTSEIDTYSRKCINAKQMFGYKLPLIESYKIFSKSRTRDILIKKIKENLI